MPQKRNQSQIRDDYILRHKDISSLGRPIPPDCSLFKPVKGTNAFVAVCSCGKMITWHSSRSETSPDVARLKSHSCYVQMRVKASPTAAPRLGSGLKFRPIGAAAGVPADAFGFEPQTASAAAAAAAATATSSVRGRLPIEQWQAAADAKSRALRATSSDHALRG